MRNARPDTSPARHAARLLPLVVLAAGAAGCAEVPVTPASFADWANQQADVEERVALTCAKLHAGSPERHTAELLKDHLLRLGTLTDMLGKAEDLPARVRDACRPVKACIDGPGAGLRLDALVQDGQCAHACSQAVSTAILDAKKGMEQGRGLLGMMAADGEDRLALLTAARNLVFARAAVHGLVLAADGTDALVDEVATVFGSFAPLAGPILRKLAAALVAMGADEVVARLEKIDHRSAAALAERACDVTAELNVRSTTARSVGMVGLLAWAEVRGA